MAFENWPYSDYHDLNLDWVLRQTKRALEQSGVAVKDAAAALEYAKTYFDTPEFADMVNGIMERMADDGTLANIINQQIFTELDNRVTKNATDIATLRDEVGKVVHIATPDEYGITPGVASNRWGELLANSYVHIPEGNYICSGNVDIANDVQITGRGAQIELTGGATWHIGRGTWNTIATAQTINKGATTLPRGSLTADNGDVLFVKISSAEVWNNARAYYTKGEIVTATYYNGTLQCSGTVDSYSNATLQVCKPTAVNIDGLAISASYDAAAYYPLKFDTCTGTIDNMTVCVNGGGNYMAGVSLRMSKDIVMHNINIDCYSNTTAGLDSYGLSITECQNITIDNINARGHRHGIAVGNHLGAGLSIVDRYITITNGVTNCDEIGSLNTHGNTEYFSFSGAMLNGANLNGDYITVVGDCWTRGTARAIFCDERAGNHYTLKIAAHIRGTFDTVFYMPNGTHGTGRGGVIDISGTYVDDPNNTIADFFVLGAPSAETAHTTINATSVSVLSTSLTRCIIIDNNTVDCVSLGGSAVRSGANLVIKQRGGVVSAAYGPNYQALSV